MFKKDYKKFSLLIIAIILTLGLSISFQSLLAAWTAPLANPPTCLIGNPGCDADTLQTVTTRGNTTGLGLVVNGQTINHQANNFFYLNSYDGFQLRINSDAAGVANFQINNSANSSIFTVTNAGNVSWLGALQGGTVPWARLVSFPSACSAGQYVTAVGATLTCATPAGGGTVTGVTATAPVVSSGGTAPIISMAPATASANGYMTSAYASKLDGIAAGATVGITQADADTRYVNVTGDTMTGNLTVNKATPLINLARTSGNPEIDLGDAVNHWGIYNDYTDANKLKFWYGSNLLQIDTSGNLTLNGTVDGIDISAQAPNWTTGYNERRQWDGGAANLVAATGRTSLGLNTLASAALACSANQIPKWNGSIWACANDASQWTTSGSNIYYNTGNVGVGIASPGAKLEVAGQIKITGGTPCASKILTSDAAGLAAWQDLSTVIGNTGKYQVSCAMGALSLFSGNKPACCRIETKNGLTSCKRHNGTVWVDIGDPFGGALTSGNTGKYSIACSSSEFAGYAIFSCGRLNTETGSSDQCRYYDGSWNNCPGGSAW